jgi:hypothetical protein
VLEYQGGPRCTDPTSRFVGVASNNLDVDLYLVRLSITQARPDRELSDPTAAEAAAHDRRSTSFHPLILRKRRATGASSWGRPTGREALDLACRAGPNLALKSEQIPNTRRSSITKIARR